jgi:hypothetical protein
MAQALASSAAAAIVIALLPACGYVIGLGDHELLVDVADAGASDAGDAGAGEAGAVAVGAVCPSTPCAGGVCCFQNDNTGAQQTVCQSGSCVGDYPVQCSGPSECGGSTCCATLLAGQSRRNPSPPPPVCAGWFFRGSYCGGGCAPQLPNACGVTFTALMCESSADCPSSSFGNSLCCRVGGGDIFSYCMDSATRASVGPFLCLL